MIIFERRAIITLDILFWLPDHSHVLQQFIYQLDDRTPSYPRAHKFLRFWKDEIDAVISQVILIENQKEIRLVEYDQQTQL